MARYGNLLGKRVGVHYRAGDITLPATARLVADSGRSIFLEEQYVLRGRVQMFRWEIPYQCVMRLEECAVAEAAPATTDQPGVVSGAPPDAADMLRLRDHPEKA